jgi:hypothetical protein
MLLLKILFFPLWFPVWLVWKILSGVVGLFFSAISLFLKLLLLTALIAVAALIIWVF